MKRFLPIDFMVSGSNPVLVSSNSEESRQLSVIPGVGIMRFGHMERMNLGTAR